jgi:hypothetical protein
MPPAPLTFRPLDGRPPRPAALHGVEAAAISGRHVDISHPA